MIAIQFQVFLFFKFNLRLMSSFIEVVSGFLGAAISVTACNPMDVMRVRYQVQGQYKKKYLNYCGTLKKIAQQEGFRGFYRGYSIALISIPLFNAVYFPLYEKLKKECAGKIHNSTLNIAISCGLSGLICNVILNPLWVLKTRMQTEIFNSNSPNLYKVHLFKIASNIIKNQGVKALYNGLAPSLFGVLHPIIYFPLYENLKMTLHEKALFPNSLTVLLATIIGKCTILNSDLMHYLLPTRTTAIMDDEPTKFAWFNRCH